MREGGRWRGGTAAEKEGKWAKPIIRIRSLNKSAMFAPRSCFPACHVSIWFFSSEQPGSSLQAHTNPPELSHLWAVRSQLVFFQVLTWQEQRSACETGRELPGAWYYCRYHSSRYSDYYCWKWRNHSINDEFITSYSGKGEKTQHKVVVTAISVWICVQMSESHLTESVDSMIGKMLCNPFHLFCNSYCWS